MNCKGCCNRGVFTPVESPIKTVFTARCLDPDSRLFGMDIPEVLWDHAPCQSNTEIIYELPKEPSASSLLKKRRKLKGADL